MSSTPEQEARANIDQMLHAAAWAVHDYNAFDPLASLLHAPVPKSSAFWIHCASVNSLGGGELNETVAP